MATTESWNSFVAGPLAAPVLAGVMTPDANISIRRIQAVAQTGPVCSSPAVLLVTDGTGPGTTVLSLTTLLNDSGAINVNHASNTPIYLLSIPGIGCTTTPANVNVLVQYRTQ